MSDSVDRRLADNLIRGLFGIIGSFLVVLSLPRLLRLFGRRVLPRLFSEILLIALTGLLFEKFTAWIARDDDRNA